jgi:hypothetical protein
MFSRLRDLLLAQSNVVGQTGGRVDWEEKRPIDNTQILPETGGFLKLLTAACG